MTADRAHSAALASILDEALAALTRMDPAAIQESESRLRDTVGDQAGIHLTGELAPKARLARAMSLQATQLWYACLPEAQRAETYAPDGSVNALASGAEISITG